MGEFPAHDFALQKKPGEDRSETAVGGLPGVSMHAGTDTASDAQNGLSADEVVGDAEKDKAFVPDSEALAAGARDAAPSGERREGGAGEVDGETLPAEGDEPSAPRLIAFLQEGGKLSNTDLARARRLAEESGDEILRMLVRLGLVSERDMALAFSRVMGIPLAEVSDFPDLAVATDRLSLRFLKDARVLPLREDEAGISVASANPADPFVLEALSMASGKTVTLAVALPSEIELALERLYEKDEDKEGDDDYASELGEVSEDDIEHLKDLASEAPVIRMVNQIVHKAVESRASDIHIEPFEDELKVRYRVDGILKEVDSPPPRSTAAIVSRIKILAKLNIAERRLPQDGRIPLRVQGKELDLRVSTVPTMFGESVVMRLLDKESVRFDFSTLGFDGSPRKRLDEILEMPYGIFLVTGPTGSGKSTTLYTAMSRLNTQERKIITVEDPVEYQLPGINQIQVKPQIGMTFAGALRSIVRQDPDIIMVGEMRDLETARIAVQSALTGHVVLSTLHTNDAASGVTRLLDMGVDDYLLTSTINGILAQRLVRRLCPVCRERYEPVPELALKFIQVREPDDGDLFLHRPVGCERCNGTGYLGRMVISEVLIMSDGIRQAVLSHATSTEIQRQAIAEGMLTMYDDGLRKALDGRTTIDEVMRVAEET
jgi:general secretion pathway protein E